MTASPTTSADPGAEFDQEFEAYVESGAVPDSTPPTPPPADTSAATRPELWLTRIAHKIETISDYEGRLYELRFLHTYPLGVQIGLTNAYNTILRFMNREQDPFAWPPPAPPEPDPEGVDVGPLPPGLRTGPLDEDEAAQRRFLLDRIAEHAVPTMPKDVREGLEVPDLESLAVRFFNRSREIRASAEMANRPTSVASSPGSSTSTAATSTPGSGATTPVSSPPAPKNSPRSRRKGDSGS